MTLTRVILNNSIKMTKYWKLNDNKSTTFQIFWNVAKLILKSFCFKNKKCVNINELCSNQEARNKQAIELTQRKQKEGNDKCKSKICEIEKWGRHWKQQQKAASSMRLPKLPNITRSIWRLSKQTANQSFLFWCPFHFSFASRGTWCHQFLTLLL